MTSDLRQCQIVDNDCDAAPSSVPQRLQVAYILHRFPYLTETFIMREMHCMRENGVDCPAFDEVWEDYRMATLYNWVYITVVAGTLDVSNAAAFAWISQSLARHSAAADDLEVLALLPS